MLKQQNMGNVSSQILSNAVLVKGNSLVKSADDSTFWIVDLIGTGITLKDKDGNTVLTHATTLQFDHYPLKLDGGFDAAGTDLSVRYAEVRNLPKS